MTLTRFALAHLKAKPLTTLLNIALLSLGTASIVVLLLMSHQLSSTLTRNADNIDVVLGAKGSPIQLILSAVYHADIPTGNIEYDEAKRWAEDRRVAQAVPLSLGDSVRGFRIVGTTHEYLELYDVEMAEGTVWQASLEAVIGADVAEATDMSVGDQFVGAHGFSGLGEQHADTRYRVVGVLEPSGSVVDRLVLTSLDSVWDIHGTGHDHGNHEEDEHHEDEHHEDEHHEDEHHEDEHH